jgi:hypothetical protein
MTQGITVCDAGLQEINEDTHPVYIVVIDGHKESVVQEGVYTAPSSRDAKPRKVVVGSICTLRSDGGVEMRGKKEERGGVGRRRGEAGEKGTVVVNERVVEPSFLVEEEPEVCCGERPVLSIRLKG